MIEAERASSLFGGRGWKSEPLAAYFYVNMLHSYPAHMYVYFLSSCHIEKV